MPIENVIVALLAAGVLVLIIIGDWRTRSARSFALLAVSLFLMAAFSRTRGVPSIAGWVLSVLPLLPIALNARWLAPLAPDDLAMVDRISAIERSLVKVSEDFRKGRIAVPELHEKFAQIRRRAARIEAPDAEWRRVVGTMTAEIDKTLAVVAGQGRRSAESVQEDRKRFRAIYTDLVHSRRRFWR